MVRSQGRHVTVTLGEMVSIRDLVSSRPSEFLSTRTRRVHFSSAKRRAMARPMPLAAPVIIAALVKGGSDIYFV
jgi:hypothetical protein